MYIITETQNNEIVVINPTKGPMLLNHDYVRKCVMIAHGYSGAKILHIVSDNDIDAQIENCEKHLQYENLLIPVKRSMIYNLEHLKDVKRIMATNPKHVYIDW